MLIEKRVIDGVEYEHRRSVFSDTRSYWRAERPERKSYRGGCGPTPAAALNDLTRLLEAVG